MKARAHVFALVCAASSAIVTLAMWPGWLGGSGNAFAQPRVQVEGKIRSIDFSANGKWFAVGHDVVGETAADGKGAISVYYATSRSRRPIELPALAAPIRTLGFLNEGAALAAVDEQGLLVAWSIPAGQELLRINLAKRNPDSMHRLLTNPHGPQLAWVSSKTSETGKTGKLEVAQVPMVAKRATVHVIMSATKVRAGTQQGWSADGSRLLLGGAIWNWDTLASWQPPKDSVVGISVDGKRFAISAVDTCDNEFALRGVTSHKVMRRITIEAGGCPRWLWFADRDRAVLWIGAGSAADKVPAAVYLWKESRGQQRRIKTLKVPPIAAALSADGKLLAITDGENVTYVRAR